MALGRYSRVDGKKPSSSYCSTVSIVVVVALCLVGVWMLTSSSVIPAQTVDFPAEKQKSEVKDPKDFSESNTKQFEDKPSDLPEDATKADNSETTKQEEQEERVEEKPSEEQKEDKVEETPSEEKQEEKAEETPSEEKQEEKAEETPSEEKQEEKAEETPSEERQEEKAEETPSEDKQEEKAVEKTSEENQEEKSEEKQKEKIEEKTSDSESKKEEGSDDTEAKTEESPSEKSEEDNIQEKDDKPLDQGSKEVFPSGAQSEILKETATQNGSFSTQATESKNEKEAQTSSDPKQNVYSWKLCNTTAGPDFIPCLDNLDAIRHLRSTKHYEHRERHCPAEPPACLVSLPDGYKRPIEWPTSREKIWFNNVPHIKLAAIKGHQNWVKVSGEYLIFPGGGTQFKHGARHYIEFIESVLSAQGVQFKWGKSPRVVLDVGCGVASFGGYLFDKDVITMSLAPKDEHEAQVQFALERGIPAISAVMGTTRLPFPGIVFDVVHCARCRVPWHIEGGKLLLELNRVLRPGAMSELTKSMCWELIAKQTDKVNRVGVAVFRKPSTNECYEKRSQSQPPLCAQTDDRNAAWNVPLQSCMHNVPVGESERGSSWPEQWPARVEKTPYWLTSSQIGVYGKPAPEDFTADYEHWKRVVSQSYLSGMGINWSTVRNVMDMRAVYGGFAAALREINIWVMNVVAVDSPDTLPIIYERGLFGIYHDWCESFSTYPRSYDLLHADHLFSKIKTKCSFPGLVAEADRILRPEGKIIIRDNLETITELESMFRAMQYEIRMTYSKDNEGLLFVQKTMWRPTESETLPYAF
ncbi:hypothetical protein V2J09_000665 [Rumex salicifolius]